MTATGQDLTDQRAAASAAVQRASRILLARQDEQGWWSGRAAGDVTLEAEALLAKELLGIRTAEVTSAAAQEIRSMQQADGRWTGGAESAAVNGISIVALKVADHYTINALRKTLATGN